MAKKSAPTKKAPQNNDAISQHKRMAMGLPIDTGKSGGKKTPA